MMEPKTAYWISPDHTSDYLSSPTIEKKLDVFESRTRGWIIQWAKILVDKPHAGFAALSLALVYFEGHAMFFNGRTSRRKSKSFFRQAFISVTGMHSMGKTANRIADAVYYQARCGLFHNGMTKNKLVLSSHHQGSFEYLGYVDNGELIRISINVEHLVREIEDHFTKYMKRLRDPGECTLRRNFEKMWNTIYPGLSGIESSQKGGNLSGIEILSQPSQNTNADASLDNPPIAWSGSQGPPNDQSQNH